MAGNITLESLIRKEDDNPVSGRDVLAIFDHGRREVLPKLPLLGFGRSIETYVVQPDVWTQDRVIRNAIRPVRSSVVEEVHLYISYSLCCPSGRQDRAVLALAGDAGADGDLCLAWERRLLRYFEELAEAQARTGGDFVLDFFGNRNDFIQQVSLRLASETGLSVRLRLQLDGENALAKFDALDVTTGRTDVRPKGLNNDFSIQVKGRFRIVETLRSQALLRLLAAEEQEERLVADLVYEIKNEVQQFVAGQVSIDGFAAQAADETRIRLRDSLNERLASRHGRVFDHVDILMPDVGHQRPGLVRFEHATSVKPSDSKTELPIVSDVAMQLDNPGRLQAMYQQDPLAADPEAWLRHHLEPIVRDALFNQTYADLVVNLDNDLIRVPLVAKAREIGYIIKHYSAVPEQPVLRLRRDGVRFTTGVQEYGTRNTRINVALDIAVAAEMPTALASIERFIRFPRE